eukprot:gene24816-31198_t
MYNIQFGKAVISFCALVTTNGLASFIETVSIGGWSLVLLGLTGAIGQIFVFVTIYKFGALNCALIGLVRKMLSLVLSFVLYGHTLNAIQVVGLTLAIVSMIANFWEKGGKKKDHAPPAHDQASDRQLLAPDVDNDEVGFDIEQDGTGSAEGTPRHNLSEGSHIELVRLQHGKTVQQNNSSSSSSSSSAIPDLLNAPNDNAQRDLLDLGVVDDLVDRAEKSKQQPHHHHETYSEVTKHTGSAVGTASHYSNLPEAH